MVMLEHKVDIKVLAIIGLSQGTEAKIAKRNLSWSPSVQSKSKTRARSDHAGWIGTVESSSADTAFRCNDKDNVKRIGRVILGSCTKLYHRREARRPISLCTCEVW